MITTWIPSSVNVQGKFPLPVIIWEEFLISSQEYSIGQICERNWKKTHRMFVREAKAVKTENTRRYSRKLPVTIPISHDSSFSCITFAFVRRDKIKLFISLCTTVAKKFRLSSLLRKIKQSLSDDLIWSERLLKDNSEFNVGAYS